MFKTLSVFILIIASVLIMLTVKPVLAVKETILLNVPFTSQAPLGGWKDQRQQDGCEEAVVAMAMKWAGNEKRTFSSVEAEKKDWLLRIIILSEFEKKKYGEYRDVALKDINSWLFQDYFKYKNTEIKSVKTSQDIISELEAGNIVLAPMDGRALKNPNFTAPGPERHMILIKGYNYQTGEFITNDPGTRRGESYRYSEKVLLKAIRAYSTGYHQPIMNIVKEMIVVSKKIQ